MGRNISGKSLHLKFSNFFGRQCSQCLNIFSHCIPRPKEIHNSSIKWLGTNNLISICVLTTQWPLKKTYVPFYSCPILHTNGIYMPIWHCTTPQTLESGQTLLTSVPVLHSAMIFMWYLLTATAKNPVSQRHDVIKRNLAQYHTETGNNLKQVVCGICDRYRISLCFPLK